jgi:phasin family protein
MSKKSPPSGKNTGKNAGKQKKPATKRAKAHIKSPERVSAAVVQLSDLRKAAQRKAKKKAPAAAKPATTDQARGENAPKTVLSVFEVFFNPQGSKNFADFNMNGMEIFMTKQDFKFDQFTTEAASAGREQLEAFLKFQTTFTKGFEEILRTAASMTQSAAEKQAEYTKQLMGAKTINEFSAAQNKIAQASFDEFMAGATKISEMSVKVMNESLAPLNDQMAKGMQKASKKAA